MRKLAIISAICAWTLTVSAAEFEKVLVPIAIQETPGAMGSIWISEGSIYNANDTVIEVKNFECGIICGKQLVAARTFMRFAIPRSGPGSPPGHLIYLEKPLNDRFEMHMRTRDLSRQSLDWGAEVPIARESAFRSDEFNLLDVPHDERFRTTIRIYEVNAANSGQFLVRFYSEDDFDNTSLVLHQFTLALQFISGGAGEAYPGKPSYAQFGLSFRQYPQLAGVEKVRVQIIAVTPGLSFWTFAGVVNNETHHGTYISPQ